MADEERVSVAAIEARASMALSARPPAPGPEMRAAAETIVSARMVASEIQPRTVATAGLVAKTVEHVAVFVDVKRGEVVVDRSEVMALFDPSACAVMRLAAQALIDEACVKAALRFAWAGDRVFGPARVRTVDLNRVHGLTGDGLKAAELDCQARDEWATARGLLLRAEFRILDGVMRQDESAARAAAAAYPQFACRKKLTGLGDQALISATERLALELGYKARNERVAREPRFV